MTCHVIGQQLGWWFCNRKIYNPHENVQKYEGVDEAFQYIVKIFQEQVGVK
jgi:hypothetical protein